MSLSYRRRAIRANERMQRNVNKNFVFCATFGCKTGLYPCKEEWLFVSAALVAAIGLLEFLQRNAR